MKLIIAIVSTDDAFNVMDALRTQGFGTTKISSTGGLLQTGNTTLIIGTSKVEECLSIINEESKTRTEVIPYSVLDEFTGYPKQGVPAEVRVGGATVFILDVKQFVKF